MITVGHVTEGDSAALRGPDIDRAQRVLESKNLQLALEQVGVMRLPTGDWVRIRPIKLEKGGLLMAVEVEPMVNTRVVLQRGRKVMIAAPRYQDGRLVISVRPLY